MPLIEGPNFHVEPSQVWASSRQATARAAIGQAPCRRMLNDCLRVVEHELVEVDGSADVNRIENTLDAVVGILRLSGSPSRRCDHEGFLRHLSAIYARGRAQRDNVAFAATAVGYASVVEAISRRYPELDYREPLGQLLELMTRLFAARDNRWKLVYKHLRSVPDSVEAKQTLTRVCSADIREWFDAGVQNLFSLRDDLAAKIRALGAKARRIEREIGVLQRTLASIRNSLDPAGTGKVVGMAEKVKQRQIAEMQTKKAEVLDEKAAREDTLYLIESDIREFERRLREALRAYYLRAV